MMGGLLSRLSSSTVGKRGSRSELAEQRPLGFANGNWGIKLQMREDGREWKMRV